MATGWPMVMAVDSGNLLPVARAVRSQCPDARLVICGDDDPSVKGNPGRAKAEAAALEVGGVVVFPGFGVAA
jgi:putative DNA primase/helicase